MHRRSALLMIFAISACSEVSAPNGYVRVPAGSFMMGSPLDESWRADDEGPVHEVRLTRPMFVKITEVTQREWAEVMGDNPANLPACGPECPINNVRFVQAVDFVNRLSAAEGLEVCHRIVRDHIALTSLDCGGYRLPTEAEWAYFARAGTNEMTYVGTMTSSACQPDPVLDRVGVYCGNADVEYAGCFDIRWYGGPVCAGVRPVKEREPNPFGLYDVLGNVWEWTNDWYADDYYAKSPRDDPMGPETGKQRVIRGGGWVYHAWTVRAARRYHVRENDPLHPNIGLRPVRTAQ